MRSFVVSLLVFAVAGIGAGALVLATQAFGAAKSFGDAALTSVLPFLVGVVALVGVTVVLAIDEARERIVDAIKRREEE